MAVASVGLVLAMMLSACRGCGLRPAFSIQHPVLAGHYGGHRPAVRLAVGRVEGMRDSRPRWRRLRKRAMWNTTGPTTCTAVTFGTGGRPAGRAAQLLGGDFFAEVVSVGYANSPKPTDADVAQLNGLNCLERLYVGGDLITDGRWHTSAMPRLQKLSLGAQRITDAGLAKIAGMTQLRDLYVIDAKTTDAGVAQIQRTNRSSTTAAHGPGNHGRRDAARRKAYQPPMDEPRRHASHGRRAGSPRRAEPARRPVYRLHGRQKHQQR